LGTRIDDADDLQMGIENDFVLGYSAVVVSPKKFGF